MRSGPHPGKPLADAALLRTWVRAARRERFDCALAHNAEAALIALATRRVVGVPVVYVAHTLLGVELSAYLPASAKRVADAVGARVDQAIAARADRVIALCDDAARALGRFTRRSPVVIAPGLDPQPAPSSHAQATACERAGVLPDEFVLYTGNLDAYQELELLDGIGGPATRAEGLAPTVVVASHDPAVEGAAFRERHPTLRGVRVADIAETRALCHAARVLVMTRRRTGGFPVKLLNYMEAAKPIVAFEDVAAGLVDDRSAALLPRDADAGAFAARVLALFADAAQRARLGAGARARLEAEHGWATLAERTLAALPTRD